jgi:hypothetical protein
MSAKNHESRTQLRAHDDMFSLYQAQTHENHLDELDSRERITMPLARCHTSSVADGGDGCS